MLDGEYQTSFFLSRTKITMYILVSNNAQIELYELFKSNAKSIPVTQYIQPHASVQSRLFSSMFRSAMIFSLQNQDRNISLAPCLGKTFFFTKLGQEHLFSISFFRMSSTRYWHCKKYSCNIFFSLQISNRNISLAPCLGKTIVEGEFVVCPEAVVKTLDGLVGGRTKRLIHVQELWRETHL